MWRIIACMTAVDDRAAIAREVADRGLDLDPGLLVDIVHSVFAPRETMTADERRFLVASGAPADAFDATLQAATRARASARARADVEEEARGMSTAEVAGLLGRAPSNVRRSAGTQDLYAISVGAQLAFPRWQFRAGRPVPGLRAVLEALPGSMHPLAVESFMLSAHEELDDMSPASWLSTGGDPDRVAWLAESLARR